MAGMLKGGGGGVRYLLAALALLCCAGAAHSAVLGIDYGSEYIKARPQHCFFFQFNVSSTRIFACDEVG